MSDLKQQIEQAITPDVFQPADWRCGHDDKWASECDQCRPGMLRESIIERIWPLIEAKLPPETPPSAETELLLELQRWKGRDELREHRLNAWREVGEEMQRIIAHVDKKDLLPDWFEPRLNKLLRTYGLAVLSSPRRAGEAWTRIEHLLRIEWLMNHGCEAPGNTTALYLDDGEMQCHAAGCEIGDFKRRSFDDLEQRVNANRQKRLTRIFAESRREWHERISNEAEPPAPPAAGKAGA